MLDFDCLEKGLGIVSPPCFVYVSRKMFPMLYPVNWLYFIVSLPLCLRDIEQKICVSQLLASQVGKS